MLEEKVNRDMIIMAKIFYTYYTNVSVGLKLAPLICQQLAFYTSFGAGPKRCN